jgi:hypothetical protein
MTQPACPPVQPCFCPAADLPIAAQLVPQGGPGITIEIPIFGTQPFSVNLVENPLLPVADTVVAASVQIIGGNVLTIQTASPAITETLGVYSVTVQVCNACGSVTLVIPVEVVVDLNPVIASCVLAQQLWTPEARVPTVGDQLLAFTPAGCRSLLPPLTTCEAIATFPAGAAALATTLVTGACTTVTAQQILDLYDLCAEIGAFPAAGPLVPANTFIVRQGATCALTTFATLLAEVEASLDLCAMLQNFPNAVVQPTAVFYGQQAGVCHEFAVSDLIALVGGGCPLEATCDGTCAAPAYSFASAPTTGMWLNAGVLTLSANNCADIFEVGASILGRSTTSQVHFEAGHPSFGDGARMTLSAQSAGGHAQILGATADAANSPGQAFIFGGSDNFGFNGGNVVVEGGSSSLSAGGSVLINAGSGPLSGGNVVVTGAGTNSTFLAQSFDIVNIGDFSNDRIVIDSTSGTVRIDTSNVVRWSWGPNGEVTIGGTPGGAGDVLTSAGPGAPPTWSAPAGGTPVLYAENPVVPTPPAAAGNNAVAIGSGASTLQANDIALGTNAQALGASSSAFGSGAAANGLSTIAIGNNPTASGANSIAIGTQTTSQGVGSISIGQLAGTPLGAAGTTSIQIGTLSNANQLDGIAIGNGAVTNRVRAIVIGQGAAATIGGFGNIVIGGNGAKSDVSQSIAIGENARNLFTGGGGGADIAIGLDSTTDSVGGGDNSAIAIGFGSSATRLQSIAIGRAASATAQNAVAIGPNVGNASSNSVLIGSSGTNVFFLTSTGAFGLAGTGAMYLLPNYAVASLPTVANLGGFIYVTDESGGAVPAFSDGANWRRVTDRAIVT